MEELLATSSQINYSFTSSISGTQGHQFILGSVHTAIGNAGSVIFFSYAFEKSLFIIIGSMMAAFNPISMNCSLELMSTL